MKLGTYQKGIERKGIIVFIHGAGLPGWSWKKQVEFFCNDYRCITIDLPDHGQSSNIPFTTIENVSEEIISVINELLPGKKINLIGHSLGAKILVHILAKNKLDIDKVIISSALFRESFIIKMMNNYTLMKWSINTIKRNEQMRRYQIKSFKFNDEEMNSKMNEEYQKMTLDGYKRYMDAFSLAMQIPTGLSGDNKVKALVTYGSKEIHGIVNTAKDLTKTINGAKMYIFGKCNHLYPINNSEEYNKVVSDWLDSI